jgi:hypothetical protein
MKFWPRSRPPLIDGVARPSKVPRPGGEGGEALVLAQAGLRPRGDRAERTGLATLAGRRRTALTPSS